MHGGAEATICIALNRSPFVKASTTVVIFNARDGFRLRTLTRVLPHLRMLLSLDGYGAGGRRVRGFVNDCRRGYSGEEERKRLPQLSRNRPND
jgi:hypothetical protein